MSLVGGVKYTNTRKSSTLQRVWVCACVCMCVHRSVRAYVRANYTSARIHLSAGSQQTIIHTWNRAVHAFIHACGSVYIHNLDVHILPFGRHQDSSPKYPHRRTLKTTSQPPSPRGSQSNAGMARCVVERTSTPTTSRTSWHLPAE